MKYIYKEIIQPLIGDFFEVNAALPENDTPYQHEIIDKNDMTVRFCCKGNTSQEQLRKDLGRQESDGKKKRIFFSNLNNKKVF